MENKSLAAIIIIAIFSFFGIKALMYPGFYTSHDGWHQLVRLYHFDKGLLDGQLPVRWAGEALNGYGYPLFYFTYQLPFYLAEFFHLIGFNLADAIKITFILGYFLSGISMFYFIRDIWGNKAGLLSSILYLWAPYRFSDIYVRAAIGEHFVFIFLPLIFWGIYKLAKNQYFSGIWLLTGGLAGVILSHFLLIQFLILPLIIFSFGLFLYVKNMKKFVISLLLVGLFTAQVTGYYLIPALHQKSWITGLNPTHFYDHAIYLKQLLYSKWGYGFSFAGIENDMMSFQVGIAQWLSIGISLSLLLLAILKKKKHFQYNLVLASLTIFGSSIFLMLPQSQLVWLKLQKIIVADYPFRFLAISTFFSALVGGTFFAYFKQIKYIYLIALCLILLTIYGNRNHIRVNQYVSDWQQYVNPGDSSNTYDEYRPKWVNNDLVKTKRGKIEIIKGEAFITNVVSRSNATEYDIEVQSAQAVMRFNQIYYPTWKAYLDNQLIDISAYEWLTNIPQGKHHIRFQLEELPVYKIANVLTVISLLLYSGGLWRILKS